MINNNPVFTVTDLYSAGKELTRQVNLAHNQHQPKNTLAQEFARKIPQDQFVFCPVLNESQKADLKTLEVTDIPEENGVHTTRIELHVGAATKENKVAEDYLRQLEEKSIVLTSDKERYKKLIKTVSQIIVDVTHQLNDHGIRSNSTVIILSTTGRYGIANEWHRDGAQKWVGTLTLIGQGTQFRRDRQTGIESSLFKDSSEPKIYAPEKGHLALFAGGFNLFNFHIGALHRSPPIKEGQSQNRMIAFWILSPPQIGSALSYRCARKLHLIAANAIKELAGSSSDDET